MEKKIETIDNTRKPGEVITFSFGSLQLIDSFSFLSPSLDKPLRLNKYDNDKKLDKWTEHFKFTDSNPCDKDGYGLYPKGLIHMPI